MPLSLMPTAQPSEALAAKSFSVLCVPNVALLGVASWSHASDALVWLE